MRQDQDKVIIRLPDGMRDAIQAAAKANNRSANAEIVARLEGSAETMRDRFAMAAVAGFAANSRSESSAHLHAAAAYAVADAMLAERSKP